MTPFHLATDFRALLKDFDLASLDEHRAVIFGIRHDFTIGYANHSWYCHAQENDGSGILLDPRPLNAYSLLDAISGPLLTFYEDLYARLFEHAGEHDHDYECSTPHQIRHYQMRLIPLPAYAETPRGLLSINSQFIPDRPVINHQPVKSPLLDDYMTDDGLLICCSNCRRFRFRRDRHRWDWIPTFLRAPPVNLSHGLCEVCLDYYYPSLSA